MRKVALIVFFILMIVTTTCFAQSEEWKDPNYKFSTVKTILIQPKMSALNITQEDSEKYYEMINSSIFKEKNKRVKLITIKELEELISKTANVNLMEIKVKDIAKYNVVIEEYAPEIVDASLEVNINKLESWQVEVPAATIHRTIYRTEYVQEQHMEYKTNRIYYTTRAVQVPVETSDFVPAHTETVSSVAMEVCLYSIKDKNKIWTLSDSRRDPNRDSIDVAKKVLNNSMKKLYKILKK